jgi:hypothetical protein
MVEVASPRQRQAYGRATVTTNLVDELRCDRCGIEGRERWSESGHMDQHECTTAVEGEFEAVPSPKLLFGPSRRDTILCRRCSAKPRTISSKLDDTPPPWAPKSAAPVRDRIPAVVASGGKLNLRIYSGSSLELEVPLSRTRALLLAHELIGALLPPAELGDDPALNQDRLEERVAVCHAVKGG